MTRWSTTYADKAEFDLAHGCATIARASAVQNYQNAREAHDEPQAAFYRNLMLNLDALLAKFEARLIADTSQDAEPEEDDGDED